MLKLVPLLILAWPFIKWVLAIQYPQLLKKLEGRKAEAEIEREWGEPSRPPEVDAIGRRLLKANNLEATIRVLDGGPVNACALPNGRIYLWDALLQLTGGDEDMVAGVVAHELGHLKCEHYIDGIRKLLLAQFALGMFGGSWFSQAVRRTVSEMISKGFSQQKEEEADDEAVRLMKRAGFDPLGLARLFDKLAEAGGGGSFLGKDFGTHPDPKDRARRVRRRLKKLAALRERRQASAAAEQAKNT